MRITVNDQEGLPIGWFDPKKAVETHESETYWDGNNTVAVHGGQFRLETLYKTHGNKWIIYDRASGPGGTSWQGSQDSCYEISEDEARTWLIANNQNDHPLCEGSEL